MKRFQKRKSLVAYRVYAIIYSMDLESELVIFFCSMEHLLAVIPNSTQLDLSEVYCQIYCLIQPGMK